jgi:hypothetical protein
LVGVVENTKPSHFFVRESSTWTRYFAHRSDTDTGAVPSPGSWVAFDADDSDGRGPRAVNVTVVSGPEPDTWKACRDCGGNVVLTAATRAWFLARGLAEPTRCEACRAARRAQREGRT